jgi:alkyl hydroperoxide reductase subunit AhpC
MFWWPKDFTFVCPTEIAEFNKNFGEFRDRDTRLIGASTDSNLYTLPGEEIMTTCATLNSRCWPILQNHWLKTWVF